MLVAMVQGHVQDPIRVLNVDDNEIQRYSTTRVLMSAGFEVVEACNAKEALSLATGETDLIVLGVDLPDIDSFELTRTLKRQSATAQIPVVHLATFTL